MAVLSSDRPLLEVRELRVSYGGDAQSSLRVDGLTFDVRPGEIVGVEGRSGSGKTSTALAILKLLPPDARIAGSILFAGRNLLSSSESEMRQIRGSQISIIYQEPVLALNPVMRVGDQIGEVIRAHSSRQAHDKKKQALEMLERVRLEGRRYYQLYPHELSGGERHRIVLAQALVCRPALVIADEPTAGLDPALKVEILELIENLRQEFGTAFLLISHDRSVTSRFADRIVELSSTERLPSIRSCSGTVSRCGTQEPRLRPLLSVKNLSKWYRARGLFPSRRAEKHALDSVDLTLPAGAVTGLIGPSGCGKSTLARCLSLLEDADEGQIYFEGTDLRALSSRELRAYRPRLQYITQDPSAALNARLTALEAIAEPLLIQGVEKKERSRQAKELMRLVGLDAQAAERSCHQFSGGQKHRIAIARALALGPKILIFDESLSGLDPETQQGIVQLLGELKHRTGISQLLISHDLAVVAAMADSVLVMRHGRIVDQIRGRDLLSNRRWSAERLLEAESERELTAMEAE